jgi:outer membrane protein OmpA-like peptidoglycan-associated protein
MAELFEEVVGVLESRSSTRSLAGQFRINSEKTAGNGAVLGVPVFIADLCHWAADPAQSISLLKVLRTIDTEALGDMGRTIESRRYEPVGSDLVQMLLGDRRQQVASVISGEIGISERSANSLLPPAAWALMASIADRYGSRIDRQSLLAILQREQSDLVNAGWGPWLEATGDGGKPAGHRTEVATMRQQLPEAAEASYPLPVSRNARAAEDRPEIARRPVERRSLATVSAGPSPAERASFDMPAASVTGQLDLEDFNQPHDDFLETPLPELERSPLAAILGVLAVIGLLGGAIYWFMLRDTTSGNADGTGDGTETATVEDGSILDNADTEQLTAQSLDPMAVDLAMRDPEARSSATGIAELRFNPDDGEVCYNITAQEIGSPFQGFINVGPAGVQGTVLVDFGLLENADIGCTALGPIEMAAIAADPAGHYVEMRDPSGEFAIRAQLSDVMDGSELSTTGEVVFDPVGDGAGAVVEPGVLVLTGEVADQITFDFLSMEYNDLAAQGLEVTNDLTIVPGSPAPSGQITMASTDLFAISSATLSEAGLASVETMAQILNARPDWQATIIGHTDATGDEELNRQLSIDRAAAVKDALVAAGVAEAGIQTTGVGSTDPIGDNSTDEGRAQNRRIEFQIVR